MAENIKINIAGRMYPLKINATEEVFIRNAGKRIEKMIQSYEQNYAVSDKQDALAMCVLQLASQLEKQKTEKSEWVAEISEQLAKMEKLTENALHTKQ